MRSLFLYILLVLTASSVATTVWDFDGRWTADVLVGVRVDSLTIIGASRGEVSLGPAVADFIDSGPKGIVVEPSASWYFVVTVTGSVPSGAYQQRITDCYWGFADPDSVAGVIWDAADEPSIGTIVEYLPVSATVLSCQFPTSRKGYLCVAWRC